MAIIKNQDYKLKTCSVELLNLEGDIFKEIPEVIKGYMLHFYVGNNKVEENETFYLKYHWTVSIPGPYSKLEETLEKYKNAIMDKKETLEHSIDQFAYINLFIIKDDDIHKLMITSETFDISKIIGA